MGVRDIPAGAAAVLAAASVVTHVVMLVAMPSTPVVHAGALAMAAACLWCGVRLLRAPRVAEWTATALMAAAMVGLHLMAVGAASTGGGHRHGARMDAMSSTHAGIDPMTVAMVLAVAELLLATAVLWRLTAAGRGRTRHTGLPLTHGSFTRIADADVPARHGSAAR